jgi:AbrB family looped-hinge helix DNA binding protein
MATLEQTVKPIVQAKTVLAPNGRIVIPAAIREELGFKPGETLLMDVEDGVLRIESYPARIRRIQREIAQYIKPRPGILASDELIAERREEARREEEELQRDLAALRERSLKAGQVG